MDRAAGAAIGPTDVRGTRAGSKTAALSRPLVNRTLMSGIDRRKKIPGNAEDFFIVIQRLDRLDVRCLFALRTRGHVERDALVLLQGLEALALDSREVSEQIFAAFVRGDKAETLGVIEPFNDASCHYNFLFQLSGLTPVYDRLK
jgi:hypothetical protein